MAAARSGFVPGVLLIAVALAYGGGGCARPKEKTPAPARAPGDESAKVCAALAGTGPLDVRLAAALPLQVGGALTLFEGTQPGVVLAAIEPLGLQQTHVVGCATDQVVVFVPGVSKDVAATLEARIVAQTKARAKEKVDVPPQSAPARPRPTHD